ncbi:hypothetical protein QBC44DRAFT_370383 [Cladorrhinum sp. PSN332]|nr:hypothetical protein QBC44DRAFT_370383 [Cladorrhinum sp. PSN332]
MRHPPLLLLPMPLRVLPLPPGPSKQRKKDLISAALYKSCSVQGQGQGREAQFKARWRDRGEEAWRRLNFHGHYATNPAIIGVLESMRMAAWAMAVRTYCYPDTVIAKWLGDTRKLFELIGVGEIQVCGIMEIVKSHVCDHWESLVLYGFIVWVGHGFSGIGLRVFLAKDSYCSGVGVFKEQKRDRTFNELT